MKMSAKTQLNYPDGSVVDYTYDYENRLIKATTHEQDQTKTVTFKYDPFGRRLSKSVSHLSLRGEAEAITDEDDNDDGNEDDKVTPRTTYYLYDNEDIILEYLTKTEDSETKTETTKYIHGLGIDEPLSIERKGETYYYHADGLGSITVLTDKKQKVVQTYKYDSFGNIKQRGDKVKQPYTFTAREWDKETGLYYYRARYYDPIVGRFTSFDPIIHPANGPSNKIAYGLLQNISIPTFESLKEDSQKLNPYIYAQNQPTVLSDPFGFAPQEDSCEIKRDCDKEFAARLTACMGERVVCDYLCRLLCSRSGPLASICASLCSRNLCNPIYKYCSQWAIAEYVRCKTGQ